MESAVSYLKCLSSYIENDKYTNLIQDIDNAALEYEEAITNSTDSDFVFAKYDNLYSLLNEHITNLERYFKNFDTDEFIKNELVIDDKINEDALQNLEKEIIKSYLYEKYLFDFYGTVSLYTKITKNELAKQGIDYDNLLPVIPLNENEDDNVIRDEKKEVKIYVYSSGIISTDYNPSLSLFSFKVLSDTSGFDWHAKGYSVNMTVDNTFLNADEEDIEREERGDAVEIVLKDKTKEERLIEEIISDIQSDDYKVRLSDFNFDDVDFNLDILLDKENNAYISDFNFLFFILCTLVEYIRENKEEAEDDKSLEIIEDKIKRVKKDIKTKLSKLGIENIRGIILPDGSPKVLEGAVKAMPEIADIFELDEDEKKNLYRSVLDDVLNEDFRIIGEKNDSDYRNIDIAISSLTKKVIKEAVTLPQKKVQSTQVAKPIQAEVKYKASSSASVSSQTTQIAQKSSSTQSSQSNEEEEKEEKKKLSTGAIIGITAGVMIGIGIATAVGAYFYYRGNNSESSAGDVGRGNSVSNFGFSNQNNNLNSNISNVREGSQRPINDNAQVIHIGGNNNSGVAGEPIERPKSAESSKQNYTNDGKEGNKESNNAKNNSDNENINNEPVKTPKQIQKDNKQGLITKEHKSVLRMFGINVIEGLPSVFTSPEGPVRIHPDKKKEMIKCLICGNVSEEFELDDLQKQLLGWVLYEYCYNKNSDNVEDSDKISAVDRLAFRLGFKRDEITLLKTHFDDEKKYTYIRCVFHDKSEGTVANKVFHIDVHDPNDLSYSPKNLPYSGYYHLTEIDKRAYMEGINSSNNVFKLSNLENNDFIQKFKKGIHIIPVFKTFNKTKKGGFGYRGAIEEQSVGFSYIFNFDDRDAKSIVYKMLYLSRFLNRLEKYKNYVDIRAIAYSFLPANEKFSVRISDNDLNFYNQNINNLETFRSIANLSDYFNDKSLSLCSFNIPDICKRSFSIPSLTVRDNRIIMNLHIYLTALLGLANESFNNRADVINKANGYPSVYDKNKPIIYKTPKDLLNYIKDRKNNNELVDSIPYGVQDFQEVQEVQFTSHIVIPEDRELAYHEECKRLGYKNGFDDFTVKGGRKLIRNEYGEIVDTEPLEEENFRVVYVDNDEYINRKSDVTEDGRKIIYRRLPPVKKPSFDEEDATELNNATGEAIRRNKKRIARLELNKYKLTHYLNSVYTGNDNNYILQDISDNPDRVEVNFVKIDEALKEKIDKRIESINDELKPLKKATKELIYKGIQELKNEVIKSKK